MSEFLGLNAIRQLSDRMAFITVGLKASQFLKLLRKPGSTAVQVQTWLLANPDQYRDIFDNYYITQAIIADDVSAKLVYDSEKGAELAINSYSWMSEFIKQDRCVDVLMTSTTGMRALWNSDYALKLIFDNRSNSRGWQRFFEYATSIRGRWATSGISDTLAWMQSGSADNGTYLPYPGITTNVIVLRGEAQTSGNTFSFNSRLRGGPELVSLTGVTSTSTAETFAAHPIPRGSRIAGTTSGSIFNLTFIPIP